jgi:hypothetical protein
MMRSIERALSVTFVLSLILTQARSVLDLDWRHLTLAYIGIFLTSILSSLPKTADKMDKLDKEIPEVFPIFILTFRLLLQRRME